MDYQAHLDNGREFYLILVMQEQLSHNRQNKAIRCYQQTDSKRVKTKTKNFICRWMVRQS